MVENFYWLKTVEKWFEKVINLTNILEDGTAGLKWFFKIGKLLKNAKFYSKNFVSFLKFNHFSTQNINKKWRKGSITFTKLSVSKTSIACINSLDHKIEFWHSNFFWTQIVFIRFIFNDFKQMKNGGRKIIKIIIG